jgi:16S rRNA G966 N2-methylase RsmD
MSLDGVEALSRGAVAVVVADEAEDMVGRFSESRQIRRLGHVAIIVEPGRVDGAFP